MQILTISDIHFGHPYTKTETIINNLTHFKRTYYSIISNVDLIVLNGDTFHKQLSTNSHDYHIAIEWLVDLAKFCYMNNIILYILEGTHSHDFNQCRILESILVSSGIDVKYKYIDKPTIERDLLGMDVLFIPDNFKHKASDTYKHVLNMLKEEELESVDFTFIHGQFVHHLPAAKSVSIHKEEDYGAITKHFIITGHIHQPQVYNRIITVGSFDRLAHGEEESKGALLLVKDGDSWTYRRLENSQAEKYVTVDCANHDSVESLPDAKHIRLANYHGSIAILRDKYPSRRFTLLNKPKKVQKSIEITEKRGFDITRNNIKQLLLDNLRIEPSEFPIYEKLINELI